MSYYKCTCEHCKNELVVSQDDLHAYFFGRPAVENDEYVYKCPECGHVNKGKNVDLVGCYQNGSNNLRFELNDEESKKAKKFINEHRHQDEFKKEGKLTFNAMDQQFTYEITPSRIGNCVLIKCNKCGETRDITDLENL